MHSAGARRGARCITARVQRETRPKQLPELTQDSPLRCVSAMSRMTRSTPSSAIFSAMRALGRLHIGQTGLRLQLAGTPLRASICAVPGTQVPPLRAAGPPSGRPCWGATRRRKRVRSLACAASRPAVRPGTAGAEAHAKDREEPCEEDDGSTRDRGSLQPCDVGTTHTHSSADRLLAQARALSERRAARPPVPPAGGGPDAPRGPLGDAWWAWRHHGSAAYVALVWSSDRHCGRYRTVPDAIDAGGRPHPPWLAPIASLTSEVSIDR